MNRVPSPRPLMLSGIACAAALLSSPTWAQVDPNQMVDAFERADRPRGAAADDMKGCGGEAPTDKRHHLARRAYYRRDVRRVVHLPGKNQTRAGVIAHFLFGKNFERIVKRGIDTVGQHADPRSGRRPMTFSRSRTSSIGDGAGSEPAE